jgi:uncharacterized protein YkwD
MAESSPNVATQYAGDRDAVGMNREPRAHARRPIARHLVSAAVTLLALGPVAVVASPSAQAATPTAAAVAAYEARVINRINAQRAHYGRVRLTAAACPDKYAEPWSPRLARLGYLKHQSMATVLRGCKAHVAAENLAGGNVSADRIVTAWMASPGHRANVLDGRLTRIGVAAVYAKGKWFVTADFTRP